MMKFYSVILLIMLLACGITATAYSNVPSSKGNSEDDGSGRTESITVNGVSFTMVYVGGGSFTMGATAEQGSDAYKEEMPAHRVTLSSYYIGQTEVTQELWQAVMGSNPSRFTGNQRRPVENVSWDDCQMFVWKLNQLTGKTFRLPTEAEWEFAARGGNKSQGYKYAGSNTIDDVAWYTVNTYDKGKNSPDYGTHPVRGKLPNELGLYDMSGNVWEWCHDQFGNYNSDSQTNPTGASSGYRVMRGGDWHLFAKSCRVSRRSNGSGTVAGICGFRLATTDGFLSSNSSCQSSNPVNDDSGRTEMFTANGVTFKMVYVAGDTFMMGITDEQGNDAQSNKIPAHLVTLSSYYIGQTEVTQELWRAVMGTTVRQKRDRDRRGAEWDLRGEGAQYPMYYVSWDDCQEFVSKLNQLTGKSFRLPTEAEWEFAARGGKKSRNFIYAGSNTPDNVAWYEDNSDSMAHPVGRKPSNELGLYDMSGNVEEWCQDRFGDYNTCLQTNPKGASSGLSRVERGGCWYFSSKFLRVSNRSYELPSRMHAYLGFRLAL